MPEHVHLLLSEPERENLALVLQMRKQMVCRNLGPASAKSPFWQARYYDFQRLERAKARGETALYSP
jgi:REP element-mobilizing transposase RayT